MEFCIYCGAMLPDGAARCPACGREPAAAMPPSGVPQTPQSDGSPDVPAGDSAPTVIRPEGSAPLPPTNGTPRYSPPPQELSTGGYLGSLLLFMIPVVGLILMLVWSFSANVKPERKKLARAYLIRTAIVAAAGLVLVLILSVLLSTLLVYSPVLFYNFF
ncbi:MAG: zinc-ribbon domain-containing protein [Gemmiger sp.]